MNTRNQNLRNLRTHAAAVALLLTLVAGLMIVIFDGCAPPPKAATPRAEVPTYAQGTMLPIDLHVDTQDGRMIVRWKQQGSGNISGYNIYISRTRLGGEYPDTILPASVTPHNATVYPGDTDPDDEWTEYPAENLTNGVKYFVSVRIVFPNKSLSRPSNEAAAVCGPRGEFSLPVRYQSAEDGYSLVQNRHVPADGADNDLYFYSKDGVDYLASPSRLSAYNRKSRLAVIAFIGTFETLRAEAPTSRLGELADKVAVKEGSSVLVRTAENYTAVIQVEQISGKEKSRSIKLRFALCPLDGEMIF